MKAFLTTFLCLLSLVAFGQDRQITGTVTGGEPPEPLIGASILIKGTSSGEVTDFDGNFTLNVPAGYDTLVFSYTGFRSEEIVIGDQTVINVVLGSDSELLEEVVVIGYGIQKKRVATGAISKLTAENLEGFQVQNVQSALEGQVAGLIVSESSGQPGSSKNILIRGVSTNGDNSPLFVVDGLQVDNIDNISPSDIESVDVLKDAATTAIYGARAANGVVIITTKKGSDDGVGEISYEGFYSNSRPWRLPEMLGSSDYIDLTREKFSNGNQLSSLEPLGFPTSAEGQPNTDWMDVIFNDANVVSHRLSARMKDLYLSMEYWDQNGVIGGEKSNYKRYSVRLNGGKDINDYVRIGENIMVNRVENQSIDENNAFGSVLADAFAYDPITGVYNDDKDYGFEQSNWVQKEYINPLSRLFLANNQGHSDQVLGNVFLEIKPTEGLIFHSDVGIDYSWTKFRDFTPDYRYHPSAVNIGNDIVQGFEFFQSLQLENYLNYTKQFGEHSFNMVVGTSYRSSEGERAGGSTSFIPDAVKFQDNFQIVDAGQDTLDLAYGGLNVDYRLISYYGRMIYDYKGKYLFTGTLRRDGSSNFGANNRFGTFPSFSAGWVISDENFFNLGPVSFMKLRTSWGVNGNDRISPLSFASRIENVFRYPFGRDPSLNNGSSLATPPNPNIKWEESIQLDIGLEVRLWNDQLTAEFDYFRKNTSDLLMDRLIPGYVGATNNPISNLGEIQNTGFEAAINYRVYIGGLRLETGVNYTTFRNEVISVAGESGFIPGWSWPVRNTPITRMSEGLPVGHFVGYKTDGIFQDQSEVFSHINSNGDLLQPRARPGDIRFVDVNGDGVINSDDITDIGSPWPDHIIGLTLNASYKGFDFSAVFSSQLGHEIFRAYERSDITFTNYQTFWLDRWTPESPSNELPRLVSTDPNNNQRPSDFYLEDGSFLRLRNLQVGYSFPQTVLDRVNLKGLRVYLTANNLLTITDYRGFDPEIGTNGWILDTGIDKGFYPSNTTYGVGLKVTM